MKETSYYHKVMPLQDKRALNMLELKVFDISQNVELIGKQLTNNQIKDIFANSYNIFCQMKAICEHAGMIDIYEVVKKMQVYSVLLANLLAERIDKKVEIKKVKEI
jgi:hypothetical protein